ncbi:hypothetical protein AYI70_g326 [Smittium culicis]|uniref:Uncharacterized protein n=1 Tax=Smittium culicis TaxID=133412 RepID=A0A1R1YH78_9FUNG|nr:hypothetical protein AYI70_g326 [Smittium culicis]
MVNFNTWYNIKAPHDTTDHGNLLKKSTRLNLLANSKSTPRKFKPYFLSTTPKKKTAYYCQYFAYCSKNFKSGSADSAQT